ncbi:MAG: nucleotide exchange factor GrpE, partial [Acidimicrobiia bacterium]
GEARLEAGELLDNLQRVAAEFDNYRKRTERDRVENVQRASQRVIESLLPALDSLDAAIALDATTDTGAKMLEGMKSTHAQILQALAGDGFAPIEALGAPFDPALHEAISVIPGEGEQIVDQEVRKGYVMGGRVIRPSLVVVGHA